MNRPQSLIVALIFLSLIFFFSSNSGFATSISAVQEQLKVIQLKLIKAKVQFFQEEVEKLSQPKILPPESVLLPEPVISKEELSASLENQVKALEQVVRSLKPRAIEEETARLEKKIQGIQEELKTAAGEKLLELEKELEKVLDDYGKLQQEVRQALEDTLKQKQVFMLQEEIRLLKGKIQVLPPVSPTPAAVAPSAPPTPKEDDSAKKAELKILQEKIQAIQAKILKEQVKAIQESINKLRAR